MFFFVCAIFNITLLLNLLIAIISQTFAEILATQTENEYKEKVDQIASMQASFFGKLKVEEDPITLLFIAHVISSDDIKKQSGSKFTQVKDQLMAFNERHFEEV